jgi:hypothetical protein
MVMLVTIESWNNNMLKVQIWLVVATRPQTWHLSFWLRTLSNTSSIGTSVIIRFSSQFQWKVCFPSYNPGWRSAWVSRHNSRQYCNLGSSSTSQKWTGGWFSNNTSGKEIGDHDVTWQDSNRLHHVKMYSGPWLRKGEPSELEIEPSGVTEDVAFIEIRGSSPHSVDMSWKVVVFESTNKTSTETFVIDVNSSLTAQHVQISGSDAHAARIWPIYQHKMYR